MAPAFDIVAIGEAMVEFNQTGDGGGRSYLQGFGGDTSNAVIAASRQGARCAFATRLGDDDFGRMCLDLWRHPGPPLGSIDPEVSPGVSPQCRRDRAHGPPPLLRQRRLRPRVAPVSRTRDVVVSGVLQHVDGALGLPPVADAGVIPLPLDQLTRR